MKRAAYESFLFPRTLAAIGGLVMLLAGADVGRAADYYFDVNSGTAYGDGPGQFRAASAYLYWSTSSSGTVPTVSLTTIASATNTSSFQFGFGTDGSGNNTNSGTVTIGSTAGSALPTVGALIFNASGTSGSGYTFGAIGSTPVKVTITGSATNGVSSGTGILVNSNVTGDTTFNPLAGIALMSNQTWTNNSGTAALNVYGPVTGAFSLTTNGAGTILLGGTNTFTNLTVGAGTTKITNASAAGSGSLTVAAGANLDLLASITKSVANSGTVTIGAGGGLTAASIGTGVLSLAGVSGTGASFTSTSASTLAPASVTMAGDSTIAVGSATAGVLSSGAVMISGTGNILRVGGVIAAGNTYTLLSGASLSNTGVITLTGGAVGNQSLALGDSGTIGRATFTFGSTATALQLAVTGTLYDLFWNGGSSGIWDYTTANWQKDGTGSNILFVQGDAATIGTASTITVDSGTFGSSVQATSLTVNNAAGTVALSGSAISTTGTFGKSGAGNLTIANDAIYGGGAWVSGGSMTTSGSSTVTSGGLNVSGGSLTANAATIVTAGGLNVSGGSFTSNATTTVTDGGVNVSGGVATLNNASTIAGGITATGGTAAFNAPNSVAGAVSASGGVISLGDIGGVGSGSILLSNNGTLASTLASGTLTNAISVGSGGGTLSGANPLTLTGAITGPGPLTKSGAGEFVVSGSVGTSGGPMSVSVAAGSSLRLTGTSKYLSGAVTPGVINGTLTFDNATITTMGGTIASGTGAIVVSGSSSFAFTATGFSTIATPISGPGSLTFDATPLNRVILSGSNSYSGGTFLNRNVGITNGSALGTGPITCIASAGNVSRINNDGATALTVANNVNTAASTLALVGAHAISLTGTISGAGNIRAVSGIADLTQQTAATMLNTGTVEMNSGGQVWVSSVSNLGSNTSIAFTGSNQAALVAKGNAGVIPQNVYLGMVPGATASIDTDVYTMTLGGTLADLASGTAGSFTKSGSGTLVLTANSTYTGDTTVSAGTLRVNGAISTGTTAGTITVAAGATLAGTGTVGGLVTLASGATLSPGASPGNLTLSQSLSFTSGANYNWQMLSATGTAGAATAWDLVTVGGTLAINSTAIDPFKINLWTLSGTGPDVSGNAANFNSSQDYSWTIATAAGGITGFDATKFRVTTTATNGTGGFSNADGAGTFSVAQVGNNLNLVFTHGAAPTVITINVASGTQTQTQAGYPTLSGSIPVVKTGGGTLVLDKANTLTGSTTVQGGVLRLADGAALSSSRLVVVAGGTGQVAPVTSVGVASLDLASGNGLLDLTSGAMTISGGMTAAELVAEILEGRGDGSWTGTSGITSSTVADQAASSLPRAVGWVDNGDGSLTTAYAAPGDTNIDWSVDILDVSNFLAAGKFDTGSLAVWSEGDFSYDGVVDILDAADFFATGLYDMGGYNTPAGAIGAVAAVPEPSTWALLAGGLAVVSGIRRRGRVDSRSENSPMEKSSA